jgi:hypothetical protein
MREFDAVKPNHLYLNCLLPFQQFALVAHVSFRACSHVFRSSRIYQNRFPVHGASHSVTNVNFNLATRLEAARKRVARINGRGPGEQIGATLEPPAQIIDVSPDEKKRV